jgi:hypothetical protein
VKPFPEKIGPILKDANKENGPLARPTTHFKREEEGGEEA